MWLTDGPLLVWNILYRLCTKNIFYFSILIYFHWEWFHVTVQLPNRVKIHYLLWSSMEKVGPKICLKKKMIWKRYRNRPIPIWLRLWVFSYFKGFILRNIKQLLHRVYRSKFRMPVMVLLRYVLSNVLWLFWMNLINYLLGKFFSIFYICVKIFFNLTIIIFHLICDRGGVYTPGAAFYRTSLIETLAENGFQYKILHTGHK